MTVYYQSVCYSQPGVKGGGQYKYYPRICNRNKMDLKRLSKRISQNCTASATDVLLVLEAIVEEVPQALIVFNRFNTWTTL